MAKRRSQTEHDRLVEYVAKLLVGRGYQNVRADYPGFDPPKKIVWQSSGEGDLPDVTGVKNGFKVFEVESKDSITDEHTAEQWKLFASYAENNEVIFYVVFPKGSINEVKNRLKELNIQANLLEV